MTWRRQIAECVFLPLVGVSMPWPAVWRMLQWLAGRGRFFGPETADALAMAAARGFADDPSRWSTRHRLIRFVDQIDPALSALRSNGWMNRHLVVEGDSLPPGPCIFAGFHYGAGFWSLRYLRHHGHPVSFLSRPIVRDEYRGEPLRYAFERWRMRRAANAGGAPVIYARRSIERIRAALVAGHSVLGMIDVPEPSSRSRAAAHFMGSTAWFPDGLIRIAASEGVPLFAYLATLDSKSGRRQLTLTRVPADANAAMRTLADLLERAIRHDPAAWHLWANWPLFFAEPDAR